MQSAFPFFLWVGWLLALGPHLQIQLIVVGAQSPKPRRPITKSKFAHRYNIRSISP
jgi:hypothetical protein